MAEIFISYASATVDRAKQIAAALRGSAMLCGAMTNCLRTAPTAR